MNLDVHVYPLRNGEAWGARATGSDARGTQHSLTIVRVSPEDAAWAVIALFRVAMCRLNARLAEKGAES